MAVRGSARVYVSGSLLTIIVVAGLCIGAFGSTRARQAIHAACARLGIEVKCIAAVDKIKDLTERTATIFARRIEPGKPAGSIDESVANSRLTFLDPVDLYQKAGLVEVYGGTFSQRRIGPIRVDAAILTCNQPSTILAWSPDNMEGANVDILLVELSSETAGVGKVSVGAELADGRVFVWEASLNGDRTVNRPPVGEQDKASRSIRSMLQSATTIPFSIQSDKRLVGSVPAELGAALSSSDASHHIRRWILEASNITEAVLAVHAVALVKSSEDHFETAEYRTISGQIHGVVPDVGSVVEMVFDDGQRQESVMSFDNTFLFPKVPKGRLVSLRYHFRGVDYYADPGRWF
jgi:hypothetical protein